MTKPKIEIPREKLVEFCRKHHIRKLALFGSVLRDDFGPDSDVDVLVEFEPGHTPGFAFITIQDELKAILKREVDLLTFKSIESSRNYIRRAAILSSAREVYVAR